MHQVIAAFAQSHPSASFIQIGAHDTQQLDPLRAQVQSRNWSGILVEPVPYVFQRLQAVCAGNQALRLENAAVADRDGTVTLYYLPESTDDHLPIWYDALASLKREVLLKHEGYIPDISQRMSSMEVPCLTFDSLCAKHGVERLDLIQIDTEGYDYEIIKLIDFARYRPRMLMYENLHLSDDDQRTCLEYLGRRGFEHISSAMDTVCLRLDGLSRRHRKLIRTWRRIRIDPPQGISV